MKKTNRNSKADQELRKQLHTLDIIMRNNRLYREKKEQKYLDTSKMLDLMNMDKNKNKEEG